MDRKLARRAFSAAFLTVVAGGVFATSLSPALAQSRTGGTVNQMIAGMGLKGYDPVNYFTDKKPAKGAADITADWGGATWHFVSKQHRDEFVKNPERFAPQYGSFCAWGVAHGKLFDVDPEHGWAVVNDKLYVNLNHDVLVLWKKEQTKFIHDADTNWPKLNQ